MKGTPPFNVSTTSYSLHAYSKGELRRAKTYAEKAEKRYRRYFGDLESGVAILVADTPAQFDSINISRLASSGNTVLPFLSSGYFRALGAKGKQDSSTISESLYSKTFTHEACHAFFASSARKKLADVNLPENVDYDDYGVRTVPDWFDEAVATLCEPDRVQETRHRHLDREISRHIPLRELFSMDHPRSTAERRLQISDTRNYATGAGILVRIRIFEPGKNRLPSKAEKQSGLFYAQSLSVAQFIAEKEGALFIGRMGERFFQGAETKQVLTEARQLPADYDELEKRWLKWVKRQDSSSHH